MWLEEFVKTQKFSELFQEMILVDGAYLGEREGREFVIVTGWNEINNFVDEVILLVEDINIDFDDIINEYIGKGGHSELWGFDDEYMVADCCNKIVCSTPHYYGSLPEFVIDYEGGERVCVECLKKDPAWYIDMLVNNSNAVNSILDDEVFIKLGYEKQEEVYQNGLHAGMNDSPAKLLKDYNSRGFDVIFSNCKTSQFYVEWNVWLKAVMFECDYCGKETDISGIDLRLHKCYDCIQEEREVEEEC